MRRELLILVLATALQGCQTEQPVPAENSGCQTVGSVSSLREVRESYVSDEWSQVNIKDTVTGMPVEPSKIDKQLTDGTNPFGNYFELQICPIE